MKSVNPFYFKDLTHEQAKDLFNKDHPISLKYNEELVNRISSKYPIISKSEVSVIVRATFESIRDFLILGKVMNFNGLLFDFKFYVFAHRRGSVIFPAVKVEVSTPKSIRHLENNEET
jgi:nucleoid DNA-binding protein